MPTRTVSPVNSRRKLLAALTSSVVFAACAGSGPYGEAPIPAEERGQRPAWLRRAIDESRRTLEERCSDFAPLENIPPQTSSEVYFICQEEAGEAAREARQAVLQEALERCVADITQGGLGECCFSKVTDRVELEREQQARCDAACRTKAARSGSGAPSRRDCHPQQVSPPRTSRRRAHTPAVEEILRRCAQNLDEVAACSNLPSVWEKWACEHGCTATSAPFRNEVALCLTAFDVVHAISCRSELTPPVRALCEARCRDRLQHGRDW